MDPSAISRSEVFRVVGEAFGFTLTKVIKLAGDAPVWILEINGKDVRVRAEDFHSRTRFCALLTQWADIIIPQKKWSDLQDSLQLLLTVAEVEYQGPAKTGPYYLRGALVRYLEGHAASVQAVDSWQEHAQADRPFAKDGAVFFALRGFQKYLKDEGERLNRLELSRSLTRIGCGRCTLNVRGKDGVMSTRSVFKAPGSIRHGATAGIGAERRPAEAPQVTGGNLFP